MDITLVKVLWDLPDIKLAFSEAEMAAIGPKWPAGHALAIFRVVNGLDVLIAKLPIDLNQISGGKLLSHATDRLQGMIGATAEKIAHDLRISRPS